MANPMVLRCGHCGRDYSLTVQPRPDEQIWCPHCMAPQLDFVAPPRPVPLDGPPPSAILRSIPPRPEPPPPPLVLTKTGKAAIKNSAFLTIAVIGAVLTLLGVWWLAENGPTLWSQSRKIVNTKLAGEREPRQRAIGDVLPEDGPFPTEAEAFDPNPLDSFEKVSTLLKDEYLRMDALCGDLIPAERVRDVKLPEIEEARGRVDLLLRRACFLDTTSAQEAEQQFRQILEEQSKNATAGRSGMHLAEVERLSVALSKKEIDATGKWNATYNAALSTLTWGRARPSRADSPQGRASAEALQLARGCLRVLCRVGTEADAIAAAEEIQRRGARIEELAEVWKQSKHPANSEQGSPAALPRACAERVSLAANHFLRSFQGRFSVPGELELAVSRLELALQPFTGPRLAPSSPDSRPNREQDGANPETRP